MRRRDSFATPATKAGVIRVQLKNLASLFNSLDPSPFAQRDLGGEAEAFVAGWAREFPRSSPLKLIIHLTEAPLSTTSPDTVASGVRNYFEYRRGMLLRDLHELLREGWRALLIGLIFLFACLSVAARLDEQGEALGILAEGLMIVGWVAMWRPLEIILYGWWPLLRRLRLYKRLSVMEVELDLPPPEQSVLATKMKPCTVWKALRQARGISPWKIRYAQALEDAGVCVCDGNAR